jgi:hypothetical protein
MVYLFLPLEFKIQTKIAYINSNQRYTVVYIIYTVAVRIKTATEWIKTAAMKKGLRLERNENFGMMLAQSRLSPCSLTGSLGLPNIVYLHKCQHRQNRIPKENAPKSETNPN